MRASPRISFCAKTVNVFRAHQRKAFQVGDVRLIRRLSALIAYAEGASPHAAARLVGVCVESVYSWIKAWMVSGVESFIYRKSSGRPARLTRSQKQRLKELIEAGPVAAGYTSGCWHALLVQDLILKEFGVTYNRFYVCQLLRNLGFSYQKARFVSDHLDEAARQRWMNEAWPKILEEAKAKGALLLFGDEASFAQWGSLSYTWAPKGKQPTVLTTGKRKGYKVFGAIDYFTGRLFFQGSEERFASESYQNFLQQVLDATDQPVILIHDGAKYHTSATTKAFVETQRERLTVYRLPSYSPDYNPIEYLWKNVKGRSTHNRYFPEFRDLVQSVDDALTYFAEHPGKVRQLMGRYCAEMAGPTMVA